MRPTPTLCTISFLLWLSSMYFPFVRGRQPPAYSRSRSFHRTFDNFLKRRVVLQYRGPMSRWIFLVIVRAASRATMRPTPALRIFSLSFLALPRHQCPYLSFVRGASHLPLTFLFFTANNQVPRWSRTMQVNYNIKISLCEVKTLVKFPRGRQCSLNVEHLF
ncbi:hypothetical protein BDY19DRAFT_343305 [Irpex rosettiformis]|uniref:Uncharacterized protein n=1 Tax=Irpex rosettiformis TaxID=378272 RepID=A0ACB8TWI8_9APHY|nr:hypothetical protein BDY19DRAFT_343305 [Irpex rosettiformis]